MSLHLTDKTKGKIGNGATLRIRIPAGLRDHLTGQATARGIGLSEHVRAILLSAVEHPTPLVPGLPALAREPIPPSDSEE